MSLSHQQDRLEDSSSACRGQRSRKHRSFAFTVQGHSEEDLISLRDLASQPGTKYLIVGKESAPTTGQLHLQGYVSFNNPRSFLATRRRLPAGTHVEPAKGSAVQNRVYCTKSGEFEEFGTIPDNDIATARASKAKLYADTLQLAKEGKEEEIDPEMYLRHYRAIRELSRAARALRCPPLRDVQAHPWQEGLLDALRQDPDDRKIYSFVDPQGGAGKSTAVKMILREFGSFAQLFGPGKGSDLAYALRDDVTIILVDIPRSGHAYMNWSVIEQFKDGILFSPKYESGCKILPGPPHVVIFSNSPIPDGIFSEDRLEIAWLSQE